MSHKHGRAGAEVARSAQAFRATVEERRGACRSVAARGFARADVGWCYEIRPMRGHWPASRAAKRQRRRPENRTPALPRPPACRALFRQTGTRIFQQASASCAPCLRSSAPDAASVSRLANMSLARAFHTSPPSQNGTTAGRHIRRRRTRHALETYGLGSAYRTVRAGLLAGAGLGRLAPTGSVLLVGRLQKLVRISRTAACDRRQDSSSRSQSPGYSLAKPGTFA